jgi:hypothetical protein
MVEGASRSPSSCSKSGAIDSLASLPPGSARPDSFIRRRTASTSEGACAPEMT